MPAVKYGTMRLRLYNHHELVQLASSLTDELIPHFFETDSGESVLAFDYDACPPEVQWFIEELLNWRDAEIAA